MSSPPANPRFARVDARHDAEFAAWFDVLERSERAAHRGRRDGWLAQEWRARALDVAAPSYFAIYSYGDLLAPEAVGALEVTRVDNLEWIRGELFVDPLRRRQGHGSAALAHLEERARELGRRTLLFNVDEDELDRGAGPSRGFAPRYGYWVVEENVVRELAWPRPTGELNELTARFGPAARDYEILSWRNQAPSELVSGLARVKAVMPIEVPDAGYGAQEELWDDARVRHHEERIHEMGRDVLVGAARHRATGEIVGFSELTVSRDVPGTAYQWDTLVVRAHRGHHLGALLKIATMRLLESGGYATRTIYTSNNFLNVAMIAVNNALGARPTGGNVTWRKDLAPVV
ncbi:MAG: GNAT family N-acetyltransferase [Acidimicrobiales bacterium]